MSLGGEILWDSFGVPHIYAEDEPGLFYGFGFAQANNHADIILRLYGEARARAAEYWGAAYANLDRWLLANDVPERAAVWLDAQTPAFRANLEAFANGFNAWALAHPDQIDPAVAVVLPVSAHDVMAHAHRLMTFVYVASALSTVGEASPGAIAMTGSNAWAVAPARSESGATLFLANPHLPWPTSYFTYLEADLNAPGVKMYGATQVGLPVLRFLFNERMGFANTVNAVLGATNYRLALDGDGYLFDGERRAFETRTKTFKVREADGSLRDERLDLRASVHGPVFKRPDGETVALRVAGLDRPFVLEQYWLMGKAESFAAFEAQMRRLQIPKFNIVYADREGHVAFIANGVLPRRGHGDFAYWSGLVRGDVSETLWDDVHSYDELPKVVDPPAGFVQNANDPPWVSTWPPALDPEAFPAYVAPPEPMSLRAQASVRMLREAEKLSFARMVELKASTHVLMADRVLPDLLAAAEGSDDPDVREAAALLAAWDRQAEADSRAALLFETWAARFAPANFTNAQGYREPWRRAAPLDTPTGVADPQAALALLKEAAAIVRERYGALDRPYGEASRFRLGDVDVPGVGGFGNMGVFNTITWGPAVDGVRTPAHGETWISLVEFGTPFKAMGLMAYGSSTQPGSPHRGDQLRFLSEKRLRTLWTTRAEVEANLEARTVY